MYNKAAYRLHKDLDIGPSLVRARDSYNTMRSIVQNPLFEIEKMTKAHARHHSNLIDISMETFDSVEKEI